VIDRFLKSQTEEALRGALIAAEAYIKKLEDNKQQYEAVRIVATALNPQMPWKPNKNKTVEIDAIREAEKDKIKLKPLFQSRQIAQCPSTGYKMQLEPYMFASPNYMIKKLNETGKYDWFVCEMVGGRYIYIPLAPASDRLIQAA
jgi:hypothetical protein